MFLFVKKRCESFLVAKINLEVISNMSCSHLIFSLNFVFDSKILFSRKAIESRKVEENCFVYPSIKIVSCKYMLNIFLFVKRNLCSFFLRIKINL